MDANKRQVGGEHYKEKIQHWDLILANNIPYMEAQIIKYVMRWRKKNGLQDLEKARHFLEKLWEVETNRLQYTKEDKKQQAMDRERAGLANNALLDRYGPKDLAPGKLYGDCLIPREYVNPDL